MATTDLIMPIEISHVFDALVTPETYPHWLVGAREIRSVDDDWPRPGSAFHHRVGLVGPFKVADLSKVIEVDAPNLLSLEVRARPFGRGRATFRLERLEPERTRVVIDEVPLGHLAWLTPALDPLTERRNRRSLEQLADLLLTGASHRAPG